MTGAGTVRATYEHLTIRRGFAVVLAGVLASVGLAAASVQPAAAAEPAVVGHCHLSPHHTGAHWDLALIQRKYGHTAHVSKVTFWWDIPSRGGRVNGDGTIEDEHARAATPADATNVYATVVFSAHGSSVGSFSTGVTGCTASG